MADQVNVKMFDDWLSDESEVAALTMQEWLASVEGRNGIVFPPTYTLSDTDAGARFNKGEQVEGVYRGQKGPSGYNIDVWQDGSSVCQIDSVGSQGNRIEPMFKREPYRDLVPQIVIRTSEDAGRDINLLDAGHRAADALVRFSDLSSDLESAFLQIKQQGNAKPLAKIAPTSLVFGAWDSRATQVKLPRVVRSVIRAFGVRAMHRSAQYIPPVEYVEDGLLEAPSNKTEEDSMSQLGLRHAPAPWTHGGIQAKEIRREATLNLVALRALGADSPDSSMVLRRYILGISLVALTAKQDNFLREGCQLVPDPEKTSEWQQVQHDGSRKPIELTDKKALAYARLAARDFSVGEPRQARFNSAAAREALGQSKEDRKKLKRAKAAPSQTGA